MKSCRIIVIACLIHFVLSRYVIAEISVIDDTGAEIRLEHAAQRIVSLAPNLTELLFAAGAGHRLIATVRYSDYPESAKTIPVIGDSYNIDLEAVMLLAPDLIVLWESGTGEPVRRRLAELGFTVYRSEPDSPEKIASSILRLGKLAGTELTAATISREFTEAMSGLQQQYSSKPDVPVFYQFWDQPIFTVNRTHLISRIIELCGGTNIFADLPALTPQVTMEAVLVADPAVIIASGDNHERPGWLDNWRLWPTLTASANNHLYFIPPDLILRHTARIIDGATMMCEFIDEARRK